MSTRDALTKGIAPGSLPHGERAELEAGLASIGGAGEVQGADPNAGAPDLPVDNVDDPLAALISGELNPGGDPGALTAGLSVGPGAGPLGTQLQQDPKKVRLQQVASQARSPLVRAAARAELRRITGESL